MPGSEALLYAFAQTHGGAQHRRDELYYRVVPDVTDEGYEVQGQYRLQVYARPKDPGWRSYMNLKYGAKDHVIVFYSTPFEKGGDVEDHLRGCLCSLRRRHEEEGAELDRLLKPVGL